MLCFWGLQQLPCQMNNSTCACLTYSYAVHLALCSHIPSHLVFSCPCIVLQVVLRILCYCCRNTSESACTHSVWAPAAVRSYRAAVSGVKPYSCHFPSFLVWWQHLPCSKYWWVAFLFFFCRSQRATPLPHDGQPNEMSQAPVLISCADQWSSTLL